MSVVVNKTRLPVTEWQTASGSVVSISDARKRNAKSLSVALEPIQSGSGDPSPDNIRPISGRSSVTAVRDGKNLLNPMVYVGCAYNPTLGSVFDTTPHATQFTVNADRTEFTIETTSTWKYYCLLFPLVDGQTYYRSMTYVRGTDSGQIGSTEGYLDADFKVLSKTNNTNTSQTKNGVFVIPEEAKYYYVILTNRGTAQQKLVLQNPQIELGNAKTDYEPFRGNTYTLSLGQTVYGGTVDLCSGVGTLTMANIASYNGETIGDPWMSSMDKYVAGATPTTGAQVVYTLATPITFQLTPTQIEMLMRNNTIWSDDGIVTVNYARIHS